MTESPAGGRNVLRSWRTLLPLGVLGVVAFAAVLVMGLGSGPTASVGPTHAPPPQGSGPAPSAFGESPLPSPTPAIPGSDPVLGTDGRFTILLLGSDFRGSSPGNRTDTIMIVSIVPDSGAVSVVSIPRDTARFPLRDGTTWDTKLNGLYPYLLRHHNKVDAGSALRREIGSTLRVEIDAFALIGMVGLTTLVDEIGGVDVVVEKAIHDPYFWTNDGVQGISFAAGKNHLNGERALIFARTRKGDSDFQRVRRQQQLVQAVAEKVLKRGASALPALLTMVQTWVTTDVGADKAVALYELVSKADLDHVRRAVLGPKYAKPIPGSVDYQLELDKVRALIAEWYAPVPGSPAASPAAP